MAFPSQSLEAIGGEIACHLFENPNVGLKRNLFWTVTIGFAPVGYAGREWQCSMTCDWIVWPVRDWKELDGRQLEADYGEGGVECSFYLAEHHVGRQARLRLHRKTDNLFHVVMDMRVQFGGIVGDDADADMPVHGEAIMPFTALSFVSENLFPKPRAIAEAAAVASVFMDLKNFREPEPSALGFRFYPKY